MKISFLVFPCLTYSLYFFISFGFHDEKGEKMLCLCLFLINKNENEMKIIEMSMSNKDENQKDK